MRGRRERYAFIGTCMFIALVWNGSAVVTTAHNIPLQSRVTVTIHDSGFSPERLVIHSGETVIFTNEGAAGHWPASNIHPTHRLYPGSGIEQCGTRTQKQIFDSCRALEPGEQYAFQFFEEGEWRYHDHVKPALKGTVVVEEHDAPVVTSTPRPAAAGEAADLTETRSNVERDARTLHDLLAAIIEALQRVLASLASVFSNRAEQPISPEEEPRAAGASVPEGGDAPFAYDETIAHDSTAVFHDTNALYSYMKKFGIEATMVQLVSLGGQFGDCHNSAHEAGRIAYHLFDAQAFDACTADCHSGCYHGASEKYFEAHGMRDLARDLSLICPGTLNPFFSHQCIHGIGHGLTAWSDYDIFEALRNCDKLPYREASCHSGVFMENIVGGLAAGFGHYTKYLSDDPHFPCNAVPEQYVDACYFYQTSRMAQLFSGDFRKVAAACSEAPERARRPCFESMGRDISARTRGNPSLSIVECAHAPEGFLREGCLVGAVQDYFWTPSGAESALAFCRALEVSSEKQACYGTIFTRARDVLASEAAQGDFCAQVESAYQPSCTEHVLAR